MDNFCCRAYGRRVRLGSCHIDYRTRHNRRYSANSRPNHPTTKANPNMSSSPIAMMTAIAITPLRSERGAGGLERDFGGGLRTRYPMFLASAGRYAGGPPTPRTTFVQRMSALDRRANYERWQIDVARPPATYATHERAWVNFTDERRQTTSAAGYEYST